MSNTKRCRTCKAVLPATPERFFRHKTNKDGLQNQCKKCHMEANKIYKSNQRRLSCRYCGEIKAPSELNKATTCKECVEYFKMRKFTHTADQEAVPESRYQYYIDKRGGLFRRPGIGRKLWDGVEDWKALNCCVGYV